MDRMHSISVHIIWKTATAPNTGNDDNILTGYTECWHYFLHLCKNGIITTAGAPAYFLVARPVLGGGDRSDFVHVKYPPSQAIRNKTQIRRTISGQALIGFILTPRQKSQKSHSYAHARESLVQSLRYGSFDLGDGEGLAADLGQRLSIDQKQVPQHRLQLSRVHLGDEDTPEALE